MTDLAEISRNIVRLRRVHGLTQEELAYRSNLSVNQLQAIEYGCQNTTVDTLIRIAQTLEIDSRVFGIFARTDKAILAEIRRFPRVPECTGGPLQICQNIYLLRKAKNLTQEELARRSHISTAYLRDIEHGCANVTVNKLLCIARAFDLTLPALNYLTIPEETLMKLIYTARAVAELNPVLEDSRMPSAASDLIEWAPDFRTPMPVEEILQFQNGSTYPVCPRCQVTLEREYQSYCDRCGQCLNWKRFRYARIIHIKQFSEPTQDHSSR